MNNEMSDKEIVLAFLEASMVPDPITASKYVSPDVSVVTAD